MQPPPLAAQFEDRRGGKARQRLAAISIDGLAMSATATLIDAVTTDTVVWLRGGQRETELLFHRARQEAPHAVLLPVVACIISSMLAPSGRLSSVSMRSCLVTRAILGGVRPLWRLCFLSRTWRLRLRCWTGFCVPFFRRGTLEVWGFFTGKGSTLSWAPLGRRRN